MSTYNEELNRSQASKRITNTRKTDETSNEERHSKNARESAMEQNYPRIDTENL
ncbi:hypothetical protein [Paucisalibacillus globulus]|jgi:hypothetical protein|uniref:hypothetical protein n=1 Tax=Paucisalibacillus globulus TaxID=351095 RepID=UPI001596D779|nr:hypothetical protein [Paucisalibacillus globulus]